MTSAVADVGRQVLWDVVTSHVLAGDLPERTVTRLGFAVLGLIIQRLLHKDQRQGSWRVDGAISVDRVLL